MKYSMTNELSSCSGFFCFCFFERMWSFFFFLYIYLILWVFCVFVPKEISGCMGLLEIGLVTVFMSLFLGFFYFLFFFSGFDGDWVWLLDLDLGFARDCFGCLLGTQAY